MAAVRHVRFVVRVFRPLAQNMHIIETTASIPTKYCTVIKTAKCAMWVTHIAHLAVLSVTVQYLVGIDAVVSIIRMFCATVCKTVRPAVRPLIVCLSVCPVSL